MVNPLSGHSPVISDVNVSHLWTVCVILQLSYIFLCQQYHMIQFFLIHIQSLSQSPTALFVDTTADSVIQIRIRLS